MYCDSVQELHDIILEFKVITELKFPAIHQ